MVTSSEASDFREQITRRLEASQANVAQHRDSMDRVMQDLEAREVLFNDVAKQLYEEVLVPTLASFSDYFENAKLEDVALGYCASCQLRHSIRFPARASVSFRITHNETIESLTVQYEAQILPVFIRFDRSDVLDLSISDVDSDVVLHWMESKMLGFLDSYLQIETHEQYQRDNVALDPVCGMQVARPKGLAYEHQGQTYYFCAQRCLSRFVENPLDFVHSSGN